MPGYMHPCRYCNQLIEPDANVCPICGKVNPSGPLRCQKCRNPIAPGFKRCSHCGLTLETVCPKCHQATFLGDYCQHCDTELVKICKKCRTSQPIVNEQCVKCKKPL